MSIKKTLSPAHILKLKIILKIIILSIIFQSLYIEYLYGEKIIIIDADYTFQEAISGTEAPEDIVKNLVLIDVEYYSFDKKLHQGQLVLHKDLIEDVQYIFKMSRELRFPISKVIPIVKYNWSDSLSMLDNNTSAFNYRKVAGTTHLSNHATGRAIDINPIQNPYRGKTGKMSPNNSKYNPKADGTLTINHPIVLELLNKKWTWGGNWKTIKDWQHFELP